MSVNTVLFEGNISDLEGKRVKPTSEKQFPPHGCKWVEDNNDPSCEFKPDWCSYAQALTEHLKTHSALVCAYNNLVEELGVWIGAATCPSEKMESCELGDVCECRGKASQIAESLLLNAIKSEVKTNE